MRHELELVLALLLAGCGARQTPEGPPPPLSLTYSRQTRPRTDFELSVPPRGFAQIAARRTLASSADGPAGFFGAPLGKKVRADIQRVVDEHGLLGRHDEPELDEKDSGSLKLSHGKRSAELGVRSKDAGAEALLRILDGLASQSIDRPVAALSLRAEARFDGPNAKVAMRFVQLGAQPIELAVTHQTEPLRLRVLLERGAKLVDEQQLDVARMVSRGIFPEGWRTIAPGEKWTLPPLSVRLPADDRGLYARVEASVIVRTKGRAPTRIELYSPSVSVAAEEAPE